MRKKIRFIVVYILVIPVSFLLVSLTLFTIFEYTVVADIKEFFTEVDEQETLDYGKVLFETRSCSGCHAIVQGHENIGPNLFGLSDRKSLEYIRQSIVSPNAIIADGFTANTMPNFGEILDDFQVNSIVEYVSSIK